tara:strand:- start:251 stop:454 length:204 start_codon:yes stop_codon:yes gene_type:complete
VFLSNPFSLYQARPFVSCNKIDADITGRKKVKVTLRVHNLGVTSPDDYLKNEKKVPSRSRIGTIKIA